MSEERITLRISLPLPFPSAAPLINPGKSRICIFAPRCSITPGIQVRVVNAYPPVSECASVTFEMSVDFPTEGNPTKATVASPDFRTSNPLPPPLAFEWAAAFSSLSLSWAILAFNFPMWALVALFFWVLSISARIISICSLIVAKPNPPVSGLGWLFLKALTPHAATSPCLLGAAMPSNGTGRWIPSWGWI